MRFALVTDAWHPQVNGVVRSLSTMVKKSRCSCDSTARLPNLSSSKLSRNTLGDNALENDEAIEGIFS